jgi:site-specific recombinase XerD
MTHLRKMMLEELERRNYAQTTISSYIRTIEDFARYFRRPPDQLTPEHIREYQAYLFRERKLAASTVTQRLAALRFFYTRTIKKAWSVADTPYPKKTRHLPSILSPEEVAHLIDSSQTRFHRVVLMTLYATGVRRAELSRLQIPDIDSRRMVIHIRGGKGRQDRDVMLSPTLLEAYGQEHFRFWELAYSYDGPRRSMRAQALSVHSIHLFKIAHVKQKYVHVDYMLQVRIRRR